MREPQRQVLKAVGLSCEVPLLTLLWPWVSVSYSGFCDLNFFKNKVGKGPEVKTTSGTLS